MIEAVGRESTEPNGLSHAEVTDLVNRACSAADYRGKRVLLIVPDGTRTAPIGILFQALHHRLASVTREFDVLIALGTHQPMSEKAICGRLEITEQQRRETYSNVRFFNHAWNEPSALKKLASSRLRKSAN